MKRILSLIPWWCAVPVVISMAAMLSSMVVWTRARMKGNVPVGIVFAQISADPVLAGEEVDVVGWPAPIEHSGRGRELFTPPNLVYDVATNRFRMPVVPDGVLATLRPDLPNELEVLEVRAEPYPVQLVGHAGAGASLRGIFEIAASGESVAARAGHTFAGLGLTVESVQLRRVTSAAALPEGSRRFAVAILRDALSGEHIELASTERRLLAPPVAYARLRNDDRLIELREGVLFDVRDQTYRVRALRVGPAGVEVESETGESWLVPARAGRTPQ